MIKRENVGLKKKAFWLVSNATLSTNAAENVKKEIRGNKKLCKDTDIRKKIIRV